MPSSVDAVIERGRKWLWKHYTAGPGNDMAGWPQYPGTAELTVWGGTLDGLRALRLQRRDQPLDPRLGAALRWIRGQQLHCGGFDSCEIEYPAAETTAWVLVALGELGIDANDKTVVRAVSYLLECVAPGGGVTTTPDDPQDQRVMPMALAVWALSKYRDGPPAEDVALKINNIKEQLRLVQDRESGGWGVSHGAVPNVATTAQVVHALCSAGVSPADDYIRDATRYIIGRQNTDGGWSNSYDEWFTKASPRRPYRCLNHAGWWALVALMHSVDHDPKVRIACRSAVRFLVDKQMPDGAWRFEEYEDTHHVWLTAQIITALEEWRLHDGHDSRTHLNAIGDAAAYGFTVFRNNIYNVLLGVLLASQFLPPLVGWAVNAGRFFGIDKASLANNLLSTGIWAVSSLLLVALIARLRGGS